MTRRVWSLLLAAAVGCVKSPTSPEPLALTVVHAGTSARGPFVAIDGGALQGLKKGEGVCFVDAEGHDLGCGKIESLKAGAAGVALEPDVAASVKVGARVVPVGPPAPPQTAPSEPVPQQLAGSEEPKRPEPPRPKDEDGQPVGRNPDPRARLRAHYLYNVRQPVSYNAVAFAYKARADAKIPPWQPAREVAGAALGFKLAYHAPLGPKLGLAAAFFYCSDNDVAAESSYDPQVADSRVNAVSAGALKGLNLDADYAVLGGAAWTLYGLGGLGVLASTMTMDAVLNDANTGKSFKIASYTSYLYALALDAGLSFEYRIGSFILAADALTAIPLATVAHGDSGYVDFSDGAFGVADHQLAAVRSGVDHKTSGLGLSLGAGAGWHF